MPAVMMPAVTMYTRSNRQNATTKAQVHSEAGCGDGPTPECEACTTLVAGAQRVMEPHSDECRTRMEELMQRDEDTLVQQRLHADRL